MHLAVITWVIAQMHTQNDVEIFPSVFSTCTSSPSSSSYTLSLSSVSFIRRDFPAKLKMVGGNKVGGCALRLVTLVSAHMGKECATKSLIIMVFLIIHCIWVVTNLMRWYLINMKL